MSEYNPPKLSKTALKVIEQAIDSMQAVPDSVDMSHWVRHDDRIDPVDGEPDNYCGTTACLAGHLGLALGLPPVAHVSRQDFNSAPLIKKLGIVVTNRHVSNIAAALLKLNEEQDRLFNIYSWPTRFEIRYRKAKTARGRANATIARLRHYLDTGE